MLNLVCCAVAVMVGIALLALAHWCHTHICVPLEKPEPPGDTFRDGDYEGPLKKGEVPDRPQGQTLLEQHRGDGLEPVEDPWTHPVGAVANTARVGIGMLAAYIGVILVMAGILGSVG